jgi:DNA-directed RNA polymerase delta subunit
MSCSDLEFDSAWKLRSSTKFDNIKANIIGLKELIKSKEKLKREIDIVDLKNLRYVLKKR